MIAPSPLNRIPSAFARVTEVLRRPHGNARIQVSEIPAPGKLAPYAIALGAEVRADEAFQAVTGESIEELATGRIVLLFDPDRPAEWDGEFRLVSYIRAELESEMGNEAMLGPVAWSWLTEALETNDCEITQAGGTTTRVVSESFGTLADRPCTVDLELRASWTPVVHGPEEIENHVDAWVDLISLVAGLPPVPDGVTPLPGRHR